MILNNILSAVKNAKSIAIMSHISVDGDGLGSSLALGLALRKINKEVTVYLEEEVPYIYSFLPGKDLICYSYEDPKGHDVAIALDSGDLERLGNRSGILKNTPITINIDHHHTNTEFAFYNYVQTSSSAVGEIIYQMIKMMDIDLDKDISTCLYVSITTDTGGFRYSNTTSLTHQIVSDLVNNGVNVAEISQQVFETTSLEKVKLIGQAVNALEILENGKVAVIVLTDEMLKAAGAKDEDSDGIVNIGRNIRGVEVAAVLRQKGTGLVKANLRSKSYVDVSAIANMFKGGGHKRAAGFTAEDNIEGIKRKLLEDIKEAL